MRDARKFGHIFFAATAAFLLSLPCTALAAQNQVSVPTPMPRILVIDRAAIMRNSMVGLDVAQQAQPYMKQAEDDLKGQDMALRKEGEGLQQQLAILAADVKARKIKDFQTKEQTLQDEAEKKQNLIRGGVLKAQEQIQQALGPILQGIMAERGGNLLLDRNAVVLGTIDVDVTNVAIERLNRKLPKVKVELTPLPPGMEQQLQQQQQQQRAAQ